MQIKIHRYKEKAFVEIEMYISPHHRSRIYLHFDQAITLYLALPFPQAFILLRLDEDVNAYIHNEHDAMTQNIFDFR